MPTIPALTTFTANTKAKAAEVNANFSAIRTTVNSYAAFKDQAETITAPWSLDDATLTDPTLTGTVTATGATISGGTVAPTTLTIPNGTTLTGATLSNPTITGTVTGFIPPTIAYNFLATTQTYSGAATWYTVATVSVTAGTYVVFGQVVGRANNISGGATVGAYVRLTNSVNATAREFLHAVEAIGTGITFSNFFSPVITGVFTLASSGTISLATQMIYPGTNVVFGLNSNVNTGLYALRVA